MPQFFQPAAFLSDEFTMVAHPVLEVEAGLLKQIHGSVEMPDQNIQPFPNEIWTRPPSLLHAHGESFHAPSQNFHRHSFAGWAKDLLTWREKGEEVQSSFRATFQSLRQAGTGYVVFHVNPDSMPQVSFGLQSSFAFPFWEFFSPDEGEVELDFGQWQTEIQKPVGVALHAPFSVSLPLAKKVANFAAKAAIPLSVHLGEHAEERQFLQTTAGPLAQLMARRGRPSPKRTWASPVEWLLEVLPDSPGPVWVVHGGNLTVEELETLKAKKIHLIWCPGTHRYFDRPKPNFFQADMSPPCLGCDSMASNTELNPLAEFRLACAMMPEYSSQQWWGALTTQAEDWLAEAGLVDFPPHSGPIAKPANFLRFPMKAKDSAADFCRTLATDPELQPLGPVDFLSQEFPCSTY